MDYHNAAGFGLNSFAGGDRIAVTGNTIPNPARDGTFPTNFRDGVVVWVNTPHCTMLGDTITDNGGRVATPLAFNGAKIAAKGV